MNVALFGGTGFIGSHIVDELVMQGHHPKLLVRPGSENKIRNPKACTVVTGTITNTGTIYRVLDGCDGAIYNIGIIREYFRKGINYEDMHFTGASAVINRAQELGVTRFLYMSANGVRPDGTGYQKTKYKFEEYLRKSEFHWTIFRPSIVFGDPRGQKEFCTEIRNFIINQPLPAPLFYRGIVPRKPGSFKFSPIHVQDVANIFVRALSIEDCSGKTFNLCGPRTVEWKKMIDIIAQASGTNKRKVPVPVWSIRVLASMFDRFSFFPITRD